MDAIASTPHVVLGPFYPVPPPEDAGADLLRRAPTNGAATETALEITGRVLTVHGTPIPDALVEIWHANGAGRYVHPRDKSEAPLDPAFRGYGRQHTDAEGRYRFRSLKPGAYRDGHEWRAPHVHFQVTGQRDRLVTQLFFADDPLHHADRWFRSSRRPHMLESPLVRSPDDACAVGFTVTWDIVLGGA